MLALFTMAALLGAAPQVRTTLKPPMPKPHDVRVSVVDQAGKPVPGCPISLHWKKQGGVFKPIGGAVTGKDGTAICSSIGFEPLIAFHEGRMGYLLWRELEGQDKAQIVLFPTTKVKLDPQFSPKLNKGEKVPVTMYIKPGEFSTARSREFFMYGKEAGFQFEMDGASTIDLPIGSYYGIAKLESGNCTMSVFNAPQKNPVPLTIHWEPNLFGKPAPTLQATRTIGKFNGLRSLKGKWVYVDFWATWCQPCIAEMPNVIAFYKRNASKRSRFEILSVHSKSGSEPAVYKKAIGPVRNKYWGGQDLPFPILFDGDGKIGNAWRISTIPSGFLIDPSGKVVPGGLRDLQLKLDAAKP